MVQEIRLGSTYVMEEQIGRGAMGQVWRGRDTAGRTFAFKVLRSEFAEDRDVVQRFVHERSILTSVDHPSLVRVHDLVVEGSTLAIVMDLVEGGDLAGYLARRGPLPPADVAGLGSMIASGLAVLHAAGIVHRDVKPQNILIDGGDYVRPRLADFGIAKLAELPSTASRSSLMGTPQYLAPELADGARATAAVDVYSLGIVLYELACGVPPYFGGTPMAVLKMHADKTPGRPPGVPDGLWIAIKRAVAKNPEVRPSALELAELLGELANELVGVGPAPLLTTPPPPEDSVHSAGTITVEKATRAQAETEQIVAAPEPRKKRRIGVLVGAVAGVLVLAGGAFVAVQALGGPEDAANEASAATATEGSAEESTAAETDAADEETTAAEETSAAEEATEDETPTPDVDEPATMPDVVGGTLAAAERALGTGVEVATENTWDETTLSTLVTAQEPAAGEPVGDAVTLAVTRQPATVYLDRLTTLATLGSSSWEPSVVQMSGQDYSHALVVDYDGAETGGNAWNLSRGFERFRATAGLNDTTDAPKARILVEVFTDQVKAWEGEVAFGDYVDIDLDVTDVLRLEVAFTVVEEDPDIWGSADVVLGDARLLGVPGEIPELEEQ